MEKVVTSNLKLGIIAGGQLGKMLIQDASKWDVVTYVLDPEETCPAGSIASRFVRGDYRDFDTVLRFGRQVDVLTYEIENINVQPRADGGATLSGSLKNTGLEPGTTVALRFHIGGLEGTEVGTLDIQVQAPAVDQSQPFRGEFNSTETVSGYTYEVISP